ncbi:hypothetical protein BT63DRAFT_61459 [Microthyrium microscopicum]|uniref:MHYT domain-containing protein n=1 Tax=Microthyrium microscopicum TaxID=703497 RepID=A0A6A6U2E7_9PEZI|nr:hypothetical protein BT63DRAFT_61459 [Microthyrium microscopicum]
MTNDSTITYAKGDIVPYHFSPQIIVASVIPAILGAFTAVELLHRKSRQKGWVNWLYQLGIAVSMGLVAIWCMHFVGNRAIILGDGRPELQLYYSPGFTALSVFLPIVFLFFGFSLVQFRTPEETAFWPLLIVTGVITGLAITGMHYVGNFGISNYDLGNPAAYVVGAAAIAIVASIIALSLFFYFKERWLNTIFRRMACSVLLAGAVSGMHWLATVGTTYRLRYWVVNRTYDRNVNLIVAMICAILACAVCFVFAFLTQRRKRMLADRAQHVVLASATFDSEGKLLVTQEGLPPCRKVTKQFNQKSFDDEFNVAHPVFQWLYRVTFNWPSVTDLVPGMRSHLRAVGFIKDRSRHSRPSTGGTLSTYEESDIESDYSVVFREYFCVAAEELATSLDVPLEDVGVLYNGILTTGSISNEFTKKRGYSDLEKGLGFPTMFGKGQLLFVVRRVDKAEAAKLTAVGYRFAQPKAVSEIISRTMKVPHADITNTVERLWTYSQPHEPLSASGSYLACFAIRATVKASNRSWDILVPANRPNELPHVELSNAPLKMSQLARLHQLDGLSVGQCIAYLNNVSPDATTTEESDFIEHLLDQITKLTELVPEDFFKQAVFSAQPVAAPGLGDNRDESPPQLYAFSVIPDVHGASVKSTRVTYIPLSFFQCIQRVYKHSPDHSILAQRIHREFAAILTHKDIQNFRRGSRTAKKTDSKRFSRLSIPSVSVGGTPRDSFTPLADETISIEKDAIKTDSGSTRRRSLAFGGIMVSSDTKVEVFDKDGHVEMSELGVRSEAGVASEAPTYVDELFRMTSARWRER